jgi:hypothetical protein
MTVDIFYNCTGARIFNVTFPTGFTVHNTGAPCGKINNSLVSCNFNDVPGSRQGWYYFSAPTGIADYTILTLPTWLSNTANCSALQNISLAEEGGITSIPQGAVLQEAGTLEWAARMSLTGQCSS